MSPTNPTGPRPRTTPTGRVPRRTPTGRVQPSSSDYGRTKTFTIRNPIGDSWSFSILTTTRVPGMASIAPLARTKPIGLPKSCSMVFRRLRLKRNFLISPRFAIMARATVSSADTASLNPTQKAVSRPWGFLNHIIFICSCFALPPDPFPSPIAARRAASRRPGRRDGPAREVRDGTCRASPCR